MEKFDRFLGSMFGLAVGDAVGTTVEFRARGNFSPVEDMVGGGPFALKAGQWTDDTSMALCLAESLIKCEGVDLSNQLEKYLAWYEDGHLSSTGVCFDIGNTTRQALLNFKKTRNPYSGPSGKYDAGNGSIMRLAPVAILYSYDSSKMVEMCVESSKTTHQSKESLDGCELFGALIYGALEGQSKEDVLSSELIGQYSSNWSSSIREIALGSYKTKSESKISSSGYVAHTLEAALWAFYHTQNFKDGLLKVVNLGDDADTTGAVYGQLAGAYYGINAIPLEWREKIVMYDTIQEFTEKLFELHQKMS
ncbi:ADP-ribosylglycohydrolase family protein [Bacillaceae bacterium S4-13-56]